MNIVIVAAVYIFEVLRDPISAERNKPRIYLGNMWSFACVSQSDHKGVSE